jgi:hypothetical protein
MKDVAIIGYCRTGIAKAVRGAPQEMSFSATAHRRSAFPASIA